MTPFKALYGRDPPSLTRPQFNVVVPTEVQDQLSCRDSLLVQLRQNSHKAQQFMKYCADKKRRHVELNIGDQVLVKLQPYRQNTVALRNNQKLGMRFFGPFPIIARIGEVAYKLQLLLYAK